MTAAAARTCLRCGYSTETAAEFCRRCGLPYGASPAIAAGDAPSECPVCYAKADRIGTFPAPGGGRTSYERHAWDHEKRPVGDDDWLETLRDGDDIVIERWRAPFSLTRRYLVTGQWDGGKDRTLVHNAVVLAMVDASRAAASASQAGASLPGKDGSRHGGSRLGFLHRGQQPAQADGRGSPDDKGRSEELVAARRAVAAVRERYLTGSRR